jgi:hypothetical protein
MDWATKHGPEVPLGFGIIYTSKATAIEEDRIELKLSSTCIQKLCAYYSGYRDCIPKLYLLLMILLVEFCR